MPDDEADPELLQLLRDSLRIPRNGTAAVPPSTGVLSDAEFIYSNAIDVAIDRAGTVAAAKSIWDEMQRRSYSASAWSEHELHPTAKNEATLNFIFTMDLLNFSFWSELDEDKRYTVTYAGKRWTGYWGLVACLQRALGEGIPITDPNFWWRPVVHQEAPTAEIQPLARETDEADGVENDVEQTLQTDTDMDEIDKVIEPLSATNEPAILDQISLAHIFRGDGDEATPLLDERLVVLQQAGRILHESFDGSVVNLVNGAQKSAASLVNKLAEAFPCFRDETRYEDRTVRFLKRAQIFVADVWAAFEGESFGAFDDIDSITMFADYRVPQQLHALSCLSYSPPLDHAIRSLTPLASGSNWEIELRGCSIWAVELIRRRIRAEHPESQINAVLIDFFLYDLAKEREKDGVVSVPHHRTRSIWY